MCLYNYNYAKLITLSLYYPIKFLEIDVGGKLQMHVLKNRYVLYCSARGQSLFVNSRHVK